MPKPLRLLVRRLAAASPDTLPAVADNEAVPTTSQLVAHFPGGVTKRMTLKATAAFLSVQGYSVTAPASGTPATAPGQVTGLALVGSVYNGTAQLIWSATPTATSYKIERRALGTAIYVTLLASTATASASVSGLPYETTQEIRVTASNAAGAGIPSAALSVVIPAYVAPASGAFSVPFRIKAVSNVPAGSPVTWFQPIAPGDVMPGERLVVETDTGTPVQHQQDQEVTWPSVTVTAAHRGTLRGAAISILTPAALTAGQVANFVIKKTSGAPNRTGHTTLAAIKAASDIVLKASGLDLGADVMQLNFNSVTGAFPEANAGNGFSYGSNPAGGWETIRSGPLCVEWLAWGFTAKVGGGQHKWQKAQLYVRVWSNGAREITPVLSQPNTYGPSTGGNVGPDVQTRIACYAELFDGATRLRAFGGTNDPGAFDIPVSTFQRDATTGVGNYLQLLDNCDQHWGRGSAIGMSGSLPTGVDANTAYYPYDYGNTPYVAFSTARGDAALNFRGTQVSYSSVPASGTVRIMPAVQTYPGTAAVLMLDDAHPIWTGATSRPQYLVAHDEAYLIQKTRAVPPYDLSLARPQPDPNASLYPYRIGSLTNGRGSDNENMVSPDRGSDDADADRLGPLPYLSAGLLLLPFDAPRDRQVRGQALRYAGFTILMEDERSGRTAVADNGPGGTGGAYPSMGPSNPTLRGYNGDGSVDVGSPAWGGYRAWRHSSADDIGHPGIFTSYQRVNDGAHLPEYNLVPYLRTGHHLYAVLALATSTSSFAGCDSRRPTIGSRTYHGAMTVGGRDFGWPIRSLGNAEAIVPDTNPARAYVKNLLDDNADFRRDFADIDGKKGYGLSAGGGRAWMWAFAHYAMGMEVWRGVRSAWQLPFERSAIFHVDGLDDQGPTPNAGWTANQFEYSEGNAQGTFPTIQAYHSQFLSPAAPLSPTAFPADGLIRGDGDGRINNGYIYNQANSYTRIHCGVLTMHAICYDEGLIAGRAAGAARVKTQLIARLERAPVGPAAKFVEDNTRFFPQYALAAVPT